MIEPTQYFTSPPAPPWLFAYENWLKAIINLIDLSLELSKEVFHIMLSSRRLVRPSTVRSSHRLFAYGCQSSTETSAKDSNRKEEPHAERTTINVSRDEYSKTGGDHIVAEQVVASFSPNDTKPEIQLEIAGRGVKANPLEISPANTEASKYAPEVDGHPEKGVDKLTFSKRGSPQKARSVESIKQRQEEASKSSVRKSFPNSAKQK